MKSSTPAWLFRSTAGVMISRLHIGCEGGHETDNFVSMGVFNTHAGNDSETWRDIGKNGDAVITRTGGVAFLRH